MGVNPSSSIKYSFEKKLMTFSIVSMLLLVTFSIMFIPTAIAGDDTVEIIMTTFDQQQNPATDFDAGDHAFVGVSFDMGNENLTMYNISLLTFNESVLGMANASILCFENWISNNIHTISNSSGNITNINASGDEIGNKLAFVLNLSLIEGACGVLYVNVSGVEAWGNSTSFGTIDFTMANETINIHPRAPLSMNTQTINSSAVNLSFSKMPSADKVYIERNTVSTWTRETGTQIGNESNSYLIDESLSPETTYYYQAWSWNETKGWYSLQNISASISTSQNGIFMNGTVVNYSNPSEKIVGADIRVMKMDSDYDDGGDEEQMGGYYEFTNTTDSNGYFEINLSDGGPGQYELEIEKTGFVCYFDWDLQFHEDEYKQLGSIRLPMMFDSDNQATINGYIENDSTFGDGNGSLENAEIMLLNMNFNYMIETEGMDGGMDKETNTSANGYFEINASFPSNYSIIAFIDGYYAQVNGPFEITSEGQMIWSNMTMDPALPDDLDIIMEFTDLDDATITLNCTIRAESPVFRYSLDIIPEIGNSNGVVSASEVSDYLEYLAYSGPGFSVGDDDEEEDTDYEGGDEMGGGPDFLGIPIQMLLDGSSFDSYVSGSHNGTLDHVANTTAGDNTSIYYNATFNITLDGKIQSTLQHLFNITTEHNNSINLNFSIVCNDFYNISSTSSSTNMSVQNTNSNLSIMPGENDSDEAFAYANITLELNQSSYSLPIIEVPTWNVTDWWDFNTTGNGPVDKTKYTLIGKPLRRWDRYDYYMGDEQNRYLCYKLAETNSSVTNQDYVTINDLQWISMQDNNISLTSDLDFPLYGGKTWNAITWWGETALATIVSTNTNKVTTNETHSCVMINYTNISDSNHLLGQQWYSPTLKFFVNRTQNISGLDNITWNLSGYSHGPFIESVVIGNITNQSGLIECLYANLSINVTKFYDGPSSYILEGCLYKENYNGPPEDIMWVHDDSDALRDIARDSEPIYINITYDGGIINASGVSGPYTGQLEFREDNYDGGGSDFWIDTVDFYSFEVNYSSSDFIAPAVGVENIEVFGNGTAGSYNYLTLNTTLLSNDGGTYRMHAGLDKIINHTGGWQDWRWITGAGTNDFTLSPSAETNITLNFPGQEIYERGYNGPYYLHLEIEDVSTNTFVYQNEWYVAHGYSYDDFARPCVFFNKTYMGYYQTHDYINQSTYLTVNTSITVSDVSGVGDYELCGCMHIGNMSNEYEWGQYIAGTCNDQISLSYGENMVPLNFELGEVQDRLSQVSGNNHTLKVDLSLSERVGDWIGPEIDYINYFTQNYSMNDLPDPPISLDVTTDQVTNGNLNVTVYINITADEYANQTYELNGGVHHNNTGDGHWVFITGNWTELTLQSPGSYVEYLHFSGMEIAGFGEDGPYNLWLGLNKLPYYQMVANEEYVTGAHQSTDFDQPDLQFNDSNTTAEKWGEEFFTVNVSLLVNNPGTYHIGGGVHYVEHMDGWDNWMFLDGFGREYVISGNTDLTINFSQSFIRSGLPSDYNSPLVISLGIENTSNWQSIDHMEFETSQSYSQTDFSRSSVIINNTYVFVNGNGDLQLNVTYYASSEQTCNVHGGVNDDYWWFITGEWLGDQTLAVGEHNLSLNFSGSHIFNSMRNPAKIWFGIEKSSNYQLLDNKEITLTGYSYQDFAAATSGVRIIREQMSDGSVDYMNNSGSKTYLTVNVSVNVTSGGEGTYWLDGGLDYVHNDNYEWITGTGREITLSVGNQTIPLNFRASDIQTSGKSGTFKAWINIRDMNNDWEDVDNYEYTTSYYSSDDAPAPPVSFAEKADESPDIAYINTSIDDLLTVNLTLNVSSGNDGYYDLHGGVHYLTADGWWQHITGTGEWVELSEGQNNETLNFNAGEIKTKLPDGYSDSLMIWVGINDISDWEEISHYEYVSKQFSKSDFPGAKVTITGNDESVWGNNFTVNLTINTSDAFTADTYEIHGGLNYIETSGGWDEWRFITGFHENIDLTSNTEVTYSCNFSAGDVYTALQGKTDKRLTAWISIENMSTWAEQAHIEYESVNTYSGTDFDPPSIVINCTGDFYNQTIDYLQVNLSINKTDGFDGGTTYEINSGIHYVDTTYGWDEWRFITGYHRQITPNENITIPLNFSGTALYETGETGPFEIWVGISRQGQWDDLAHDEYTTGDYAGTTFAEPEIRIVESNITDYVNASGDLTINVTVSESDEVQSSDFGDFILEGCIHWKDGYNWRWVGWDENFFNSSSGEYNITLNFDGQELNKAGDDGWSGGKLVAWFTIRNTTTWQELSTVHEYETQHSYTPDDFSDPLILFNKTNDPIEATNGTLGSYDWLNVTVNLTVNTPGTYQCYAGLLDSMNQTILVKTNTTITSGDTNVTVSFNGTKIYNKGYNGSYEFRAKIVSGDSEYDRMKTLLGFYHYNDFLAGTPEAWIENNFSSYVNQTNHDFIVNITINGSVSGNFEIYGDLFNSNTSTWITANSTNVTHSFDGSSNYTLSLRFNGTDINLAAEDGNYSLKYIRLSIDRDEGASESWEELEFMKDAYVADYHTHDEFGG